MAKANRKSTTSLNRRDAVNLIVGGAGVSGFALADSVTRADTADPIFSLIERHRAELARYDVLEATSEAARAEAYPVLPLPPEVHQTPEIAKYEACYDAWSDACNKLFQAERALVRTEPTSVAGAVAILRYAADLEQAGTEWLNYDVPEFSPEDARVNLLRTIASGLSKIARQ
jgi:hypothetical protein